MTLMEVKGHQRSNGVNYIWSKELLMQVKDDDDLCGGQRSSGGKCGKVCYQSWSEEQLMQI